MSKVKLNSIQGESETMLNEEAANVRGGTDAFHLLAGASHLQTQNGNAEIKKAATKTMRR